MSSEALSVVSPQCVLMRAVVCCAVWCGVMCASVLCCDVCWCVLCCGVMCAGVLCCDAMISYALAQGFHKTSEASVTIQPPSSDHQLYSH